MKKGSIKLFIGPMFSNKTSSLLNEVERYRIAQKNCVIVKYSDDTRYDDQAKNGGIITHSGIEYASVPILKTKLLGDLYDKLIYFDVIAIDEVQFIDDCVKIVQELANIGKLVIASGLDANFLTKPFKIVSELIAISENVIKLKAICMNCYDDASFSCKIAGNKDQEIDIGGRNKYISVCRNCLYSKYLHTLTL